MFTSSSSGRCHELSTDSRLSGAANPASLVPVIAVSKKVSLFPFCAADVCSNKKLPDFCFAVGAVIAHGLRECFLTAVSSA
jgi:hypothetical protein